MERLYCELGLGSELRDQTAVVNGVCLVHGTPNGDSLGVGNDDALAESEGGMEIP